MKSAISIPDDLFDQADALADRLGVSRSELYRRAVSYYLKLHDDDQVTEALNEVCAEAERDQEPQRFASVAAKRLAEQNPW